MMRKLMLSLALPFSLLAGTEAWQVTALNTPCSGIAGQVVGVQFASTNATGTATVSSVTDLNVGGRVVSFTNELATATLSGGTAFVSPTNTFVASRQRIIVTGDAFPGGSAIIWTAR